MRTLRNCNRLEVRESSVEGFGVFATDVIKAGEVLEEVPFVLFPRHTALSRTLYDTLRANGWVSSKEAYMENLRVNLAFKEPEKYYFKWHPPAALDGDSVFTVLPLGFGPIYNTSNTDNNADWKMQRDTFLFSATRDIAEEEEIRTFYGYFLGENGEIYACDSVFHFAIDMVTEHEQRVHKMKMLRFGSMESFNAQKQNPSAHRLHSMFGKATNGLAIKSITMLQPSGETIGVVEISNTAPLSFVYQRLTEIRNHPCPVVKFKFEYTDKEGKLQTEDVLWKK